MQNKSRWEAVYMPDRQRTDAVDSVDDMNNRYVRTAMGQAEIQSNSRKLARPLRNLLLVINASQSAQDWLRQLKGCSETDLRWLIAEGLLARGADAETQEPRAVPGAEVPAVAGAAPLEVDPAVLEQIAQADQPSLYRALNAYGREALGLVRGYRFVLEVERCGGVADLRALAHRLLDQVHGSHGAAAVARFASLLADSARDLGQASHGG